MVVYVQCIVGRCQCVCVCVCVCVRVCFYDYVSVDVDCFERLWYIPVETVRRYFVVYITYNITLELHRWCVPFLYIVVFY